MSILLGLLKNPLVSGALAALVLILGVALAGQTFIHHLDDVQIAKLDKSINDPKTGYVTQLAQCQAAKNDSLAQMQVQSDAVKKWQDEATAQTAVSRKATQDAQKVAQDSAVKIDNILKSKPTSEDICVQGKQIEQELRAEAAQ